MGSFKQISLGIICLVAAFVFGNYVNHDPGKSQADRDDVLNNDSTGSQSGNVQSRLASDPFSDVNKQPAPMLTMNRPLTSRFSLPTRPAPLASDQKASENQLPPPSQLSLNDRQSTTATADSSQLDPPGQNPAVDPTVEIPDFSAIAAEIAKSPIALPRMGMPMHSNAESASANQSPSTPLQSLANQFKAPASRQSTVAPTPQWNQPTNPRSNSEQTPDKLARLSSAEPPAPWEQKIKQPERFTSDDFNSKLNDDIFGLKQPRSTAIAPAETASNSNWRENNESEWPDNQVRGGDAQPSFVSNKPSESINNQIAANRSTDLGGRIENRSSQQTRTNPSFNSGSGFRGSSTTSNQVRTRLPFSLTESAKTELVALRTDATSKISLESTKFVNHVVESGESLQSISTRYFGNPDYYLDIYIANRNKLRNPNEIQIGATLRVPIYDAP